VNPISIPIVAMAGITFYVGFYHLLIYFRGGRDRQHLSFALVCLVWGCYDVFCVGLYDVSSVAEGARWQRAQGIALAWGAVALLWFMAEYTRQISRRTRYILVVYYVLDTLVTLLERSGLKWMPDQPSIKDVRLPFGIETTYYEATPGPLQDFQSLIGLILAFYVLGALVRFYRSGNKDQAWPMLLAMALFFAGVFADTAVSMGAYDFVYIMEYAFMGMVLVMTYTLSTSVVQAIVVQDALSESEQRYRTLFESSPESIMLVDRDGVIIDCNAAAAGMSGLSRDEMLGRSYAEWAVMSTKDRSRYTDLFTLALAGQAAPPIEVQAACADGATCLSEISPVALLKDDVVYAVQLTIRDITERKQAEREREQAEAEREQLQQQIIEAQQQALLELSTPIIPVMDRIIVMPLVGQVDSARAQDIMRALLAGIRAHQAQVVILDITGVPLVDSGVANHLNKTIQAARLKGARTIVTGISEDVAEAIVDLGIDWSKLDTVSDLQTGLGVALESLGIRLSKT
jgi:PAS domain S-box-containing protein